MTPKNTMKRKTNELEFIQSQNFCSSKGTVVRMKRQGDWRKNVCKAHGIKALYPEYIKRSHNSITGTT